MESQPTCVVKFSNSDFKRIRAVIDHYNKNLLSARERSRKLKDQNAKPPTRGVKQPLPLIECEEIISNQ